MRYQYRVMGVIGISCGILDVNPHVFSKELYKKFAFYSWVELEEEPELQKTQGKTTNGTTKQKWNENKNYFNFMLRFCAFFKCFTFWRVDKFFFKPSLARRQANCLFIRVDRPNKPRKKFEMSSKGSGKYPEPDAERDTDVASGPSRDISYRDKKCAYEIFIRVSHCELTFRHLQINVDTCLHPKNHSSSTKPNEKKSKTKLKATSRLSSVSFPTLCKIYFIF